MARVKRDPKTKEQLLDRMLSYDFDGDIRHLGEEPATIVRQGPNSLLLTFPASGVTFELSVHRPREFAQVSRREAAEPRTFAGHGQASLRRLEGQEQGEQKPARAKRKYTRRASGEGAERTGS